jgi:hypothetical protein
MNINDLFEDFDKAPEGYYSEKDDNTSLKLDSSRVTRVTFDHLHRLRLSHDVKKLEHEKKLKQTAKQYAVTPEGGAGGLGL